MTHVRAGVERSIRNAAANNRKHIFLAVISSLFLILSFPPFNLEILVWFAFVPLLFAIEDKRPIRAFLIAYLAGIIFFLGTIWWLVHVTLPGMVMVVLYEALFFAAFGLFIVHGPRSTVHGLFVIPCAWVTLEWLRSVGPFGFGWALLGYSQYLTLPVIQIADMTGIWGISFLIIFVNVGIYKVIKALKAGAAFSDKRVYVASLAMTLVVFGALRYGYFRLNNIFTGEALKVAVVQGNIPQKEKWDMQFRDSILDKYERLTRQAALMEPDIIVWPETAVPGLIGEAGFRERVSALAKSVNAPLLAGAMREEDGYYYNSALLFSADGRVAAHYDKIHLVPFGEYVPFKRLFAFAEKFAPRPIGDFTGGITPTIFSLDLRRSSADGGVIKKLYKKVKFSALICFEDVFPDLVRGFVREGAGLLINITNDAWFLKTAAPYQHAQASVFRAVETRTNVVRAANTGLSCFIDQKGRITERIESDGADIFVEGCRTREIILSRTNTFYARFGDLFAYICVLAMLISLISTRLFNLIIQPD